MKRTKKIVSFLLAAGMMITSILPAAAYEKPANAEEILHNGYASTQDAYAIYPIPQDTKYPGGEFTLGTEVQVVSENGIDDYTNAFLAEILEDYGRTKTESSTIGTGQKILLGIKGSGDAVDAWANANVSVAKADLFEQTDSYLLSAKDGTIVILGQDTDAVYYGLATLQMMFSSFAGQRFLNVQIEDYACMKMRGFIEGFYGGWSYEGRESLMRFGRDVKMNTYIYASKTDPYHKNDVLYPAEEIEKIRELVRVGEETKVKYEWSVHISYFFNSLSGKTVGSEAYNTAFNQKFESLKAKFQQLYDAGVRKFAILNDDFGSGSHTEVVRLLNKLDDEFLAPKGCENLTYCMQGYNKAWSTEAELNALKGLNASIDLFWTGDDVNSPITQETVDYVKEKTNHEAVFWLNYPVNEHGKSGIYLGNITHYARDGVTGLAGAVSNPCRYTEANKPGLFQLASLFWNNKNYLANAETIWQEAFKYLQPEVYQAYLKIASNVANCPGSGRVREGFPESEYLKDAIAAVEAKIQKGQPVKDDPQAQMLKDEFAAMVEAVETFRKECTNEVLKTDLDSWLSSLTDVATAGEAALEALFAMDEKDADTAWGKLGVAGKAMGTYDSYPSYEGNMALAGSKRLVPFVNKAISAAKNQLIPYLNPTSTEFTSSFIGTLGGVSQSDSANTAKMFDKDETSFSSFETVQKLNDSFGVDMGRVLPVHSIDILQAKMDTHHDYFHNACLEYSEDGENWTRLGSDYVDTVHIQVQDIDVKARFIRLRLTQVGTANKADYYTYVREFSINGEDVNEEFGVYANTAAASGTVTLDGLTYSLEGAGQVSLAPGEYVGVKLKELAGLTNVTVSGTGVSELEVQYSENSAIWKEMPQTPNGECARYVRLYNGTEGVVNAGLENFTVSVDSIATNLSVIDTNYASLQEGSWENLFDGDDATYAWTSRAQQNGDYIIVDFGAETPVYDLTITTPDGNPKFYNAQFYLSTDNSNWGDPIATVTNAGGDAVQENIYYRIKKNLEGRNARYLKILITGNSGYYLRISEIAINKTLKTESKVVTGTLNGELNKIVDGDISSVYASAQPSNGTDYIKYLLTENTKVTSLIFLQDSLDITNAVVTAEIYDGKETRTETLGTLNAGSTAFYRKGDEDILSVTVTWPEGTLPVLYEIIPVTGENVHEISFSGEGASTDIVYCPEGRTILLPQNTHQKEGYTFKGWNDGSTVYAGGSRYLMGTGNVTLKAEWEKKPDGTVVIPPNKDEEKPEQPGKSETIQNGQKYDVGNYSYKVTSTSKKTVEIAGLKKASLANIKVYNTVKLGEETYKVTSIAASAFKNNKKVTSVVLGTNVEKIGNSAFEGCTKLKKVTEKGKKLKQIGNKAFTKCKALKNITIKSKSLKKVGKNAFKGIHKKAVIKVPAAKYKAYKKLLAKKGQSGTVKIKK